MNSLLIRNATIFDGVERIWEKGDLQIGAGLIVAVGENLPARNADRVLDASGKFVMPGFIDAHTHLALAPVAERPGPHPTVPFTAARQARIKLASGVTTVRDVGGIDHIDINLRNAIRRGDVPGPRMLAAGRFICPTGGHCHYFADEADGADEVAKAARRQLKAGSDLVKIMVSGGVANVTEPPERIYMRAEEIAAAVYEAHGAGRKVAAHVHPARGIELCAEQGVDTIEHGAWIDDQAIDAMLKHGTALIPTEAVYHFMAQASDPNYVQLAETAQRVVKEKGARLRHAVERGVAIGVGTDCGRHFPYDRFADELVHLAAAGLSNPAVLAAATSGNSKILSISDKVGRITAGLIADLVILNGNPLDDLNAARDIFSVVQGGLAVKPNSLLVAGELT